MARNFAGLSRGQTTQTLETGAGQPLVLPEDIRGGGIANYTTTERNAINGTILDNNMIIYNTTTTQYEKYTGGTRNANTGIMTGGAWTELELGSSGSNVTTIVRQTETAPNIDPGVPPATASGEGAGVGAGSGASNWYDPNGSNEPSNPLPRWEARADVEGTAGQTRALNFTLSGTGGNQVISETNVAQVIDFDFTGTIGARTQQYAARPEITSLELSGNSANVDGVDPGVEEVWQIACTGSTDAAASGDSEELYLNPTGTADNFNGGTLTVSYEQGAIVADGTITISLPAGSSTLSALSATFTTTIASSAAATIMSHLNTIIGNTFDSQWVKTFSNNQITFTSRYSTSRPTSATVTAGSGNSLGVVRQTALGSGSGPSSGSVTLSRNAFSVTPTAYTVESNGGIGNSEIGFTNSSGSYVTYSNTQSAALAFVGRTVPSTTAQYLIVATSTTEWVIVTITGVNTTLFDGLSGYTLGSIVDHSGSFSFADAESVNVGLVEQGTDLETLLDGGNLDLSLVTLSTLSFAEIAHRGFVLPDAGTGADLRTAIRDRLNQSPKLFGFTAAIGSVQIDGSATDVITYDADSSDNNDYTISVTAQNQSSGGSFALATGTIQNGQAGTSATSITMSFDADVHSNNVSVTFGANANAAAVAGSLATQLNMVSALTAARGTLTQNSTNIAGTNYVTSTTFNASATSTNVLVKPTTVKGNQNQPTLTVNTQGTGDAAFTVSTLLAGRSDTRNNGVLTAYSVTVGGTEVASGEFGDNVSSTSAASTLQGVINGLSTHSATVSSSTITATSSTNSGDDIVVNLTAGTNSTGSSGGNDLSVARSVTQIGSASAVFGGQDATVRVMVGTEQYGTTVTRSGGTIAQLITALDTVIDGTDDTITQRYAATSPSAARLRATASNFVGATPTITLVINPGQTATVDSIGNVTATNATLAATRTVVNNGVQITIVSGDRAAYSVTQGSTVIIPTTDFSNTVSSTTAATELAAAINASSASQYTASAAGSVVSVVSDFENTTPDLTVAVSSGMTGNNAATLASTRSVIRTGRAPTLSAAAAEWTVVPINTTAAGTGLSFSDNTLNISSGLILDSTQMSGTTTGYSDFDILSPTTITTGTNLSTLVLTGLVSVPAISTTTAGQTVGYTLQYATGSSPIEPNKTYVLQTWQNSVSSAGVGLFVNNAAVTGTFSSSYTLDGSTDYFFVTVDNTASANALRAYLGISASAGISTQQTLSNDVSLAWTSGSNSVTVTGANRVINNQTNPLQFSFLGVTGDVATVAASGSATAGTTTGKLVITSAGASTWTNLQVSPDVNITLPSTYNNQLYPVPIGISAEFDAAASTTYSFRVLRRGNEAIGGLTFNLLALQELRSS